MLWRMAWGNGAGEGGVRVCHVGEAEVVGVGASIQTERRIFVDEHRHVGRRGGENGRCSTQAADMAGCFGRDYVVAPPIVLLTSIALVFTIIMTVLLFLVAGKNGWRVMLRRYG